PRDTNPLLADTDGDGWEDDDDSFPGDPSEWVDTDADGVGNHADADDDNDGLPDLWETFYGFDPFQGGDQHGDPDGDGVDNAVEYAAGTNPMRAPAESGAGLWSFDEGSGSAVHDGSGNDNDGRFVRGGKWAAGVFGKAAKFTGGRYVTVSNDSTLDITGDITLAAWIQPTQKQTQYLIKKARHGSSNGYELSLSSSGYAFVRFNQRSSGNTYKLLSNTKYPTNGSTWMFVAATFDGSKIRLYVNGELDASKHAPSLSIKTNTRKLSIGAQDDGKNPFRGRLDNAHVYDRALSAEEIEILLDTGEAPWDDDGDGVPNGADPFPNDSLEWSDSDDDGIGDYADQDDDNDGLPDAWEIEHGLNPLSSTDASGDADSDGLPNLLEYQLGMNPLDLPIAPGEEAPDHDEDGMPTWWEGHFGLDPFDPADALLDPDGDGTPSVEEYREERSPLVAPSKALAVWGFDESGGTTATDNSGNGHDGTLTGAQTLPSRTDGAIHGGIYFPGALAGSPRVRVPDHPDLHVDGHITIGAWIRPEVQKTQYLVKKGRFGDFDGFELGLSAAGRPFVRFNQRSSGNAYKLMAGRTYPTDGSTWMHVAATYDGSKIAIFIDGQESTHEYVSDLSIGANDLALSIGAQDDGSGAFQGSIDDVQLYDVAATPLDLQNIMRGDITISDLHGALSSPVLKEAGGECGGTPVNFKIAFIGDQGNGPAAVKVLELIKNEGTDAVVHAGDFDYDHDPEGWDELITEKLGVNFPYFASAGNHDEEVFYGSDGYQSYMEDRLERLGIPWTGDLGVMSTFEYAGMNFVFTAPGIAGSGNGLHDDYIRDQFDESDHVWRISSWHKCQNKMQAGSKPNETGWGVYEES
ncbi:MAG: metallophosphoesterase, partial [Myxococcales bacterium]|nr:metallophosphoesterase [Myxococcales bacterium]